MSNFNDSIIIGTVYYHQKNISKIFTQSYTKNYEKIKNMNRINNLQLSDSYQKNELSKNPRAPRYILKI